MLAPSHIGKFVTDKKVEPPKPDFTHAALNYYASLKWDLVPVRRNGKEPFEMDWPNKHHTDIVEWYQWIETGLNLGVKTGKVSNILVLDFDSEDLPEPFKTLLKDYVGFMQRTRKGWHFAFQYDAQIPNSNFELGGCHVDVRSDGGQIVLFPSVVDGNERKILLAEPIPSLPVEIRDELLKHVTGKVVAPVETISLDGPSLKLKNNGLDGCCNSTFIKLGGGLLKQLSASQTAQVLNYLNKNLLEDPMDSTTMSGMMGQIQKYFKFEEKDLAERILMYLKVVKEADARDVKEVMAESKEKTDRALAYLVKEGLIIKHRRVFQIINRANWKTTLNVMPNRIPFRMPYFDGVAYFNWGDMILVGAQTKTGKTHIAMNILKQLVEQGVKPYYLSSESGSRFQQTANHLGMGEGDFLWDEVPDPTSIELEKDAVTIIDWLQIEDKSMTDTVLKHFTSQLIKTKGLLVIFMQLKETDGNWFAPNMVAQYPALAARYSYDDDTGLLGKWTVKPIREPKTHMKSTNIACKYDPLTKKLMVNDG
jgi:hypothetical protein